MVLQLCTTVGAIRIGPRDSAGHGCVSQDKDNTLDRWMPGLVSSGEGPNKLPRVHFGGLIMLTGVLWGAVCIPCQMLANLLR